MYNLLCEAAGEAPIKFDFLCDAKSLAERLAYDKLVWEEKVINKEFVASDSRGKLFRIVRT